MQQLFFADLNRELAHLELSLTRSGRSKINGRQLERYLNYLHHRLAQKMGRSPMRENLHQAMHQLMRRARSTRNPDDARNLIRDIRQHLSTLSSLNQAWAVESRLHDLEEQVKTVAEAS